MLMVGACHVLMPKFEAKSALESIERHSVTSLITVPAMMADLVSRFREKETWKGIDSVKKVLNGGGGLSIELTKAAIKLFPQAKLLSAYGMTETCSSLTFMTLFDPTADTAGQPLRMVQQGRGVYDLCRFKIPKIFIPWKKPFPATTTGKIRRDRVRKEAVFHLQHLNSNP